MLNHANIRIGYTLLNGLIFLVYFTIRYIVFNDFLLNSISVLDPNGIKTELENFSKVNIFDTISFSGPFDSKQRRKGLEKKRIIFFVESVCVYAGVSCFLKLLGIEIFGEGACMCVSSEVIYFTKIIKMMQHAKLHPHELILIFGLFAGRARDGATSK